MQKTFICLGCKKEKEANPRLKGIQKYCGDIQCQRERKRLWYKKK